MARAATAAHDRHLRRYLLDGEHIVIAVRQHWGKIAEPVLTAVLALFAVVYLGSVLPQSMGRLADFLWWIWFAVLARTAWLLLAWRADWFIATDNRLLLRYGLITRKVAMMPLAKVTDMSYTRSLPGRIFGFGKFVMESAGQDQALREVNWIPHPDRSYRAICAEIFGVEDHERVRNQDIVHLYPSDRAGSQEPDPAAAWGSKENYDPGNADDRNEHDDSYAHDDPNDHDSDERYDDADDFGRRRTVVRRGPIIENVPAGMDPLGQQSRAIPVRRVTEHPPAQEVPGELQQPPAPPHRTQDTGPNPNRPWDWDDPTM